MPPNQPAPNPQPDPPAPARLLVPIAGLRPHPANYNQHDADEITKLAASLTEFGQRKPLTTWRDTILTGHGVYAAAQRLGWRELWVDPCPPDWTEVKALAWLAADNELARQADPDMAQLAAILSDSAASDPALLLAIGYSDAEYARLLAELDQTTLHDATPGGDGRLGNSDPARQIKAVLYAPDVADFERAILATGERNRAAALLTVCRFYLEAHDGESSAERQLNSELENLLAAQSAGRA